MRALLLIVCVVAAAGDSRLNKAALGFKDKPWGDHQNIASLDLQGSIPTWLGGALFRNGPARYDLGAGGNLTHWFSGLAMLHKFSFDSGRISYTNQFINSTNYWTWSPHSDGSEQRFAPTSRDDYSPDTSVTVSYLGDGLYLANTDFWISNSFDPVTLDTIDHPFVYDDGIQAQTGTSHQHTDLDGTVLGVVSWVQPTPQYFFYTVKKGTRKRILSEPIDANGDLMYIHSFGLTKNYFVLCEAPNTFEGLWKPEKGVRWHIVERSTGKKVANFTSDSMFVYHFVNCFESATNIICDLYSYPDTTLYYTLFLDVLLNHPEQTAAAMNGSHLVRYTLPLLTPGIHVPAVMVSDVVGVELATINYEQFNTKDYRYIYGTGYASTSSSQFFDRLVKYDLKTPNSNGYASTKFWSSANCYTGEPIFVANPKPTSEDDGVILDVVLDVSTSSTFLLVLDARSFTELARATIPDNHVVPFGFHGRYWNNGDV